MSNISGEFSFSVVLYSGYIPIYIYCLGRADKFSINL